MQSLLIKMICEHCEDELADTYSEIDKIFSKPKIQNIPNGTKTITNPQIQNKPNNTKTTTNHHIQTKPNNPKTTTNPEPTPNPNPNPNPNQSHPNPKSNPEQNPRPNPHPNPKPNPEQNPRPNPDPNPNPNPNPIAPTLASTPTPTPTPLIKKHSNTDKHKNDKSNPKTTPEVPPETPEVLPQTENEPYDPLYLAQTIKTNLRWLGNILSDEKMCSHYKRFDATYSETSGEYLPNKILLLVAALGRRFQTNIAMENYIKEFIEFTLLDDDAKRRVYLPVMSLVVLKGAPSTDKNSLPILKVKLCHEEFVTFHFHIRRLLPENISKRFYPS
jgi:hypothetical protein